MTPLLQSISPTYKLLTDGGTQAPFSHLQRLIEERSYLADITAPLLVSLGVTRLFPLDGGCLWLTEERSLRRRGLETLLKYAPELVTWHWYADSRVYARVCHSENVQLPIPAIWIR